MKISERYFNIFALILYLGLILLKQPNLIYSATIISDDTIFLEYIYNHPWYHALFYAPFGYLISFSNIIFLFATKLFPVEYAAYVVLLGCLSAYLLLAYVILNQASPFTARWAKLAALLLITLDARSSPFLQANYIHFTLALTAIVILISDEDKITYKLFYRLVLFIACISSPLVVFIMPFFIFKWLLQNQSEAKYQSVTLIFGCIIQFIAHEFQLGLRQEAVFREGIGYTLGFRFVESFDIDVPIFWLLNTLMTFNFIGYFSLNTFDSAGYGKMGRFMLAQTESGINYNFLLCALTIVAFFKFLFDNDRFSKYSKINFLLGSLIIILVGTYFSSFESREQMIYRWTRYCIVPALIVCWIIILHAETNMNKSCRIISQCLVCWLLAVGLFHKWPSNNKLYSHPVAWSGLVSDWRNNQSLPLSGLPHNRIIKLSPSL